MIDGSEVMSLHGHVGFVCSVAFSSDNRQIVTGDYDTACVWDMKTCQLICSISLNLDPIKTVAFMPDGAHIATGSMNGRLKIWDAVSGREVASLPEQKTGIDEIAFSSDGHRVVTRTGGYDAAIRVWDVVSGECLETLSLKEDVRRIALGKEPHRWESDFAGLETEIVSTTSYCPIAWFVGGLFLRHSYSSDRVWAQGAQILILEGGSDA
jgi:WD40 repeat protein